ncbi:type 2 lanthipeptide synthetase LanM family protein [Halorussus lipolyticus]|uniref:type 2 lanthipeptide synthetase LanM family protein n=1 Tax=Halorussus lipolyticus TaxID=3034024 RepID=UPI0023E8B491|nr:type 2 lanthipeptide synthetase LanM family protein [Halorussus sp. DT80]
MPQSTDATRRIAARARTLRERLDTPTDDAELLKDDADEWIAQWRDHVTDDSSAFERRLGIAGLSPEECRKRLHSRALPEGASSADWTDRLADLIEYVEARNPADPPRLAEEIEDDADDVPFVHLLGRFVGFASDRVDWESSADLLSERARSQLERWLLDRLSRLSAHALFIEFKTFLADHDRELALADDPAMPDSPRQYYDRFVAEMHEGELRSLFEEYATLARMVVTLTDQWVAAVEEFCARLRADRDALAETFGAGADPDASESLGRVADLDHRGDPHQGGRVVFHLTFDSGLELAYKPRDVRPEARFAEFVAWLNDRTEIDLDALDCLPREDYGWMAWADAEPCRTETAVSRYYRRAGALLCLLYALNFTDGHIENLVAEGEYPVVVDLETLLHPDLPASATPPASELPAVRQNSLLRTDMLPEDSPNSDVQNAAGLDAASAEQTGVQVPTFERINTDVMELEYDERVTFSGESLPELDGERIGPRDHADDLAEGFRETYRALLDNRGDLLADTGPLAAFADAEVRFVYRPTQTYGTVLTPLTTPKFLRSGRALGCKMERLARPFATGEVDRDLWPAYEAEREALWRADVPRFSVRADETTLRHDGDPVADAFDASPLKQVRRRIESLSESDLGAQLDLLRLAYGAETPDDAPTSSDDSESGTAGASKDPDRREASRAIFDRILKLSARARDGTPTWFQCDGTGEGVALSNVGDDFYRGRLGIAVFCGALTATADEAAGDSEETGPGEDPETYREFAERVASPVAEAVGEGLLADREVGAGTGVGSFVYGFAVLGELLDAEEFTDTARRSAECLTPERFSADPHADVMSGNAGAVLALLALHDRTGDDAALRKAVSAGEQLLADRIEVDGARVWRVTDDRPAIGMAHGTAGIAYALARLADATGEDRFRSAALEAVEYEDAAYSSDAQNWLNDNPDLPSSPTSWCWGRSGIGLSRVGMCDVLESNEISTGAERALAGTDFGGVEEFDHLCCGNASRVDFLLEAGRVLDDPRYRDAARELASATVRRALRSETGRFTVPKQTDNWHNPSLFKGEAGIGYTLLRLDHPDLPCVTLWE